MGFEFLGFFKPHDEENNIAHENIETFHKCVEIIAPLLPMKASAEELEGLFSTMLELFMKSPGNQVLLSEPDTKEKKKVREGIIIWATWEACQSLNQKRNPRKHPKGRLVLCLTIPILPHLPIPQAFTKLSATDCKAIATAWTWYWSGTEQAFRDQGIATIFGPRAESSEGCDDAASVICLKIIVPSTFDGVSMSADFNQRFDAISALHTAEAMLDEVTPPIPSALVKNLPFRQNR